MANAHGQHRICMGCSQVPLLTRLQAQGQGAACSRRRVSSLQSPLHWLLANWFIVSGHGSRRWRTMRGWVGLYVSVRAARGQWSCSPLAPSPHSFMRLLTGRGSHLARVIECHSRSARPRHAMHTFVRQVSVQRTCPPRSRPPPPGQACMQALPEAATASLLDHQFLRRVRGDEAKGL